MVNRIYKLYRNLLEGFLRGINSGFLNSDLFRGRIPGCVPWKTRGKFLTVYSRLS